MRNVFLLFTSVFFAGNLSAAPMNPTKIDGMYVRTFGDANRQAMVFVHGGPGFNSWDFELTTAARLAEKGYYVVVYDQRGQGRSDAAESRDFNYKQYAADLKSIIDTLKIKQPVLLGHSHGGPISIKFDEYYPGVAKKIVLISAPLNFWASLHSLFENCSRNYEQQGNTAKLTELAYVYYQLYLNPNLPADQLKGWVSSAFMHGIGCGLYSPKNLTAEAKDLHEELHKHPVQGPLATSTTAALAGFIDNENYVHLDTIDYVGDHRARFCGIYGDEDGLFTPLERKVIQISLEYPGESGRFRVLKGASHFVYIDQQASFFEALKEVCGLP